jgi:hypothetical protein
MIPRIEPEGMLFRIMVYARGCFGSTISNIGLNVSNSDGSSRNFAPSPSIAIQPSSVKYPEVFDWQ